MNNQAIIVADTAGTIRLWSAGAETLFGFAPAQALGQTLDLIIPESYRQQHHQCFGGAMASSFAKLENQPFDLPVLARGEVVVVRGVLTLMRDPNKNVIGAMAVLTLPDATPKRAPAA
jgi:PAS domain S-box-containing protein